MDDTTPATKGDIKLLKSDVKYLNEGINQVLTVLINVEKKLDRRLDNHEQRIQVLEKAVA